MTDLAKKSGVAYGKLNNPAIKKVLHRKWHEVIRGELGCFEDYLLDSVMADDSFAAVAAQGLISAGGKRIRPAFAWMAACFGEGERREKLERLMPLLAALELVHTASLVHDDIIDRANVRRGKPTVNFVHGDAAALYVGDYLIGRALELVAPYQNRRVNDSINHTVWQMCVGELRQGADFFRLEQGYRDYFYRIRRKTALLFAGSCECGAEVAGLDREKIDTLWRFGYDLGMAFQIIDDMLDLCGDQDELGKPAANDLRQGNLSLAVLYVLRGGASENTEKMLSAEKNAAELADCIRILQGNLSEENAADNNAEKSELKEAALGRALMLVRLGGGLRFAAEVAEKFLLRAEGELYSLPDIRERALLLDVMREFHGQAQRLSGGRAKVLSFK